MIKSTRLLNDYFYLFRIQVFYNFSTVNYMVSFFKGLIIIDTNETDSL
jgi:hypothetical protein